MMAAEERQEPACQEIGRGATAFRKRRNSEWELLYKREAKALDGQMRAKRKKGRAKMITDPFGHVREVKRARREASYLAKAQALADAQAAMAAAEAAFAAETGSGDDSDVEEDAPARKKPRPAKKKRA